LLSNILFKILLNKTGISMSYKSKLLLSISIISIFTLSLLIINRIYLLESILHEKTINKMNSMGRMLCQDILNDFIDLDFKNLRQSVRIASKQPFIDFVSVIDKNNIIIYSSKNELTSTLNTFVDSTDISRKKSNQFIKSFPLANNKNTFGSIQIAFSLDEMKRDINRMLEWSLVLSILTLILIVSVSWFATNKLLAPLVEMKDVSYEIAKGNFSQRINVTTKDTIGELGQSFNHMAHQLADMTNNLDMKIQTATQELLLKTSELEKANERLLGLDKLKSEFVSMVSHELRTPLTGIIGFAQTLQNLKLNNLQKVQYSKIIESEGKRLSALIENFLDIAKIESGNIEFYKSEVDLNKLIKEVLVIISLPGKIKIKCKPAPELPVIYCDKNKIKQVIINILGNAIKYSKSGGTITISIINNPDNITVCTKDNGIGIAQNTASSIFEKYFRGNDNVTKRSYGSGIGLSISKSIIEMHNGKIWFESMPGKGTEFFFSLPKL